MAAIVQGGTVELTASGSPDGIGTANTVLARVDYSSVDLSAVQNLVLTASIGNVKDVIVETSSRDVLAARLAEGAAEEQDIDTVASSFDFSLVDVGPLEDVTLADSGALEAAADDLAEDAAVGTLEAEADGDFPYDGSEGDALDGGQDGNLIADGAGDDVFLEDPGYEDVIEPGDQSTDTVVDDTINDGPGNDEAGEDVGGDPISDGSDDDSVDGGPPDDAIVGGAGADTLTGSAGDDAFFAISGTDRLLEDVVDGGEGTDTLYVSNGSTDNDGIYLHADRVMGIEIVRIADNPNGYLVDLRWFQNTPLTMIDGDSGNKMIGGTGDDVVLGNGGNDILAGGAGNDVVDGGDGSDWLEGDEGVDTVMGGAGRDIMKYYGESEFQGQSDYVPGEMVDLGEDDDHLSLFPGIFDLTAIPDTDILNVEAIHLDSSTLVLTESDVLAISSTTDTLEIYGQGVVNADAGWTQGEDQSVNGAVFNSYTKGEATLLIRADHDITVNFG